ncbi:putative GMC oxidoreductase [Daldinia vernicosa]|uniref:putative GMC oxidoreductase n=1 Tax=Daldinia vernicosa TaxID=114800 RepID=UPI002007CF44|nr:putative GMC oxidoreductase [Daldinia vernicosa]KAI0850433.1 putative GMC oxidoreductase [Daldinia vernicosa]
MLSSIITSLLLLVPSVLSAPSYQNSTQTSEDDYFDYIVVGSGPGGGPLAVNLAQAGWSVLLLEAGRNYTGKDNQQIPAFIGEAQFDPAQSWEFYVKDYSNETQAARNDKLVWKKPDGSYWVGRNPPEGSTPLGVWYPRAGTLGGCDTHNGGLTVRPSDWDWDNIANLTGDSSWTHDHMLGYFERLERNLFLPPSTPGHGFSGYQPVGLGDKSLFEKEPQVLAIAQGSAAALGFAARAISQDFDVIAQQDINAVSADRDLQNDLYQISFKKDERGRRFSSGSRVNEGVAKGLPLTVRFDSLVTKVVLDDALRATGVEYLEGESIYMADPRATRNNTGIRRTAAAKREVIVSAGAFNTPQILLLSGIGPAAELKKHNIPVLVDLPGVGRNLQDHYEVPVIQEFPNNFTFWDDCNVPEGQVNPCYERWEKNGTGPWSTLGFFNFVLKTSSVTPRVGERDLILYGSADAVIGHLPPYTDFTSGLEGATNVYTYTISESHSRNRAGTVTLRSSDPREVPEINFEYFADGGDKDVQGLVDGIEFTRKIFKSIPGFDGLTREVYPGEDVKTQEQLRQYVRDQAYGHHASSTAAIGSDDDPLSVLDSRFRVRGVKSLRVVDASAFPETPGTFPLISFFMASEKASDAILEDAASSDV